MAPKFLRAISPLAFSLEACRALQAHQLYTTRESGLHQAYNANDTDGFVGQQDGMFMQYMPSRDLILCGCAKCGTTSLYNYVYEKEFGHDYLWDEGKGGCDIQGVTACDQWQDKWRIVSDKGTQKKKMENLYSYALIRDPKERLVSSWKSKVACDADAYNTDTNNQLWRVATLKKLAGREGEGTNCLKLEAFLKILIDIHDLGRAQYLDRHFLPQNLGCFFYYPPESWSKVFTIGADNAFVEIAKRMGTSDATVPHDHASTAEVFISAEAAAMLDTLTEFEYKILNPYLANRSRIEAGDQSVLLTGREEIGLE